MHTYSDHLICDDTRVLDLNMRDLSSTIFKLILYNNYFAFTQMCPNIL